MDFYMKVISHGSLEEELKKVLSNPHTSNNLEKLFRSQRKLLKLIKQVIMLIMLWGFTN